MSDETELLNRCRDGDPNAFRILVNREKGMAWSVTAGLLSSPDLRSEAVQRAFIKAWKGLSTFSGQSSFRTWLVRIVINECLMLLKEEKRLAVRYPSIDSLEGALPQELTDPFEDLDHSEHLQACIAEALKEIPEAEQLAIRLFLPRIVIDPRNCRRYRMEPSEHESAAAPGTAVASKRTRYQNA